MQTWRWIELLQMYEVTTTGNHAGSQAFGEVSHRLVVVLLWQLFPDGLQSDFQLISRFEAPQKSSDFMALYKSVFNI